MISNTTNTSPAVSLGTTYGYAFDGDQVDLNAEVHVYDPATAVSLQLWASPSPYAGEAQPGVKIAEVPVSGVNGAGYVNATTAAILPAGIGDHAMLLVLAGPDGAPLDFANFPRRESFLLPRLGGELGYRIEGDRLHLFAGVIGDPRVAGTVSGSLRLELWALPAAYEGGEFDGQALGAAEVGQIFGESTLVGCHYDVPLTLPPIGTWQLVLMLREWSGQAYLTRDYTNFLHPVSFPMLADTGEVDAAANLEECRVPSEDGAHAAVQQCTGVAPATEVKPASEVKPAAEVKPVAATVAAPVAKAPAAKAPAAKAPAAKADVAKAPVAAAPAPAASKAPSVNTADLIQLQSLKGLPKAVAAAIVAGRPYAGINDLLKVKGVGPKLLDKLRTQVTL